MEHCLLWILLLPMILLSWQHSGSLGVSGMDLGAREDTNSSSHVLVALNYPSIQIGPYTWRYFRVEVPQAFAELSILLTRKWTGEHIGSYDVKVPMVCFRFGSPPLPDSVPDSLLESLQAAAVAAGKSENLSGAGKCSWFHANSSISLTSMQILAGVWYVGVFSDSQPSRFQSKMITRGSIFNFGIHFTVFGCKSPNLRGYNCDITIKPLCYQTSPSRLYSRMNSKSSLETILTRQSNSPTLHSQATEVGEEGEEAWPSLMAENVGPNAWNYYVLEVVDFSLKLEVRALCNHCASKGSNETVEASISVKYGVVPSESAEATAVGLAPVTILVPRRGLWYIGVHNRNRSQPLDFDLYWHVENCSSGGSGDSCSLAINPMERVLVEDASESPFNSFYGPAREESLLYSPWFLLSEVTQVGNDSSGNWTYLFIEVPRGASGAALSIQLRNVVEATMSVYARLEGFATPENWDVNATNVGETGTRSNRRSSSNLIVKRKPPKAKQRRSKRLSLDLVYPAEGMWCIGVHYVKHVASANKTSGSLEGMPQLGSSGTSTSSRFIQLWAYASKTVLHWYRTFVEWTEVSWRELRSSVFALTTNNTQEETSAFSQNATSKGGSAFNQSHFELSRNTGDSGVQMYISVQGCVNRCSGRGHCTTSYESSRLHFYSYCHCDAAHGGIDCSVPLMVPREESLHLWALIGSNFAAILPSVWALQHQAYSEWVSYTASGLASGFYHSCDAGGWCAVSYDTLQFLDFWLAFLVIIITCVYIASLKQEAKAMAHIGTAIITAAVTKENATSAWNVLFVILMGVVALLLGWALECWRLHLISSWLSALGRIRPAMLLKSIYNRGVQLLSRLRARFNWFYMGAGLGILIASGMSWVLETAETYWIWHSLWHVGIYASAFLILCSTSKPTGTPAEEHANLQQPSDPEASPMLRRTVELDAFAADHRSLDD